MRRKDRAITDPQKIDDIIRSCDCCRLGFADGNAAYIVPLNFGYCVDGENRVFYFHGAPVGRKIDLIQKNGYAGFELDTNHKVNSAEAACDYSFRFQSVVGEGPVCIVADDEERKAALQKIMAQYSGKSDWTFQEAVLKATAIFKLEVKEMSCKEHL